MTASPEGNVAYLLVLVLLEITMVILAGEVAGRVFWRVSLLKAKLPEVGFLLGYPAASLAGLFILAVSGSARYVLPAVAGTALLGWLLARTVRGKSPSWIQGYLEFRCIPLFRAVVAAVLFFTALVTYYRMPWLLRSANEIGVVAGTPVWDDARTVGMPIVLAAHGFPPHSPLGVDLQLVYPMGAFVISAALISWLPSFPLVVVLADAANQALFYGITALFLAGVLLQTAMARVLLLLAATCSVSFNLFLLNPNRQSTWFQTFFGYYQLSKLEASIGWAPFAGMLWIPNHGIAFCSVLLSVFWWILDSEKQRSWRSILIPGVFAAFPAVTSVDMTVMGLAGAGLVLLVRLIRQREAFFSSKLHRGAIVLAGIAMILLVWVNLPTLRGQVDSPFNDPFPINTMPVFNVGILASHTGLYLLLLVAGSVVGRRLGFPLPWMIVIATGYGFGMLFEYHSIWFWRFTFTAHLLLGLALCWQVDHLEPRWRKRLFVAALTCMLPGLAQMLSDARAGLSFAPRATAERVALQQWIYGNTPLEAKVVEYRPEESSVASDANLLRAGNRGGQRVHDRVYPLLGYREYTGRMADLSNAIAANDYVLVPKSATPLIEFLRMCSEPVFRNSAGSIFAITPNCRKWLEIPMTQRLMEPVKRRLAEVAAAPGAADAWEISTSQLAEYVCSHPDQMYLLRRRADQLWSKGKFLEIIPAIERVLAQHPENAEIHYSYAYSLHASGRDPLLALQHYDRALQLGYDRFWVLYNRAILNDHLKRPEAARADAIEAERIHPAQPQLLELKKKLGI